MLFQALLELDELRVSLESLVPFLLALFREERIIPVSDLDVILEVSVRLESHRLQSLRLVAIDVDVQPLVNLLLQLLYYRCLLGDESLELSLLLPEFGAIRASDLNL